MTETSIPDDEQHFEESPSDDIEMKAQIILDDLGLTWSDLHGKKILDVGVCEMELAQAARRRGIEIISVDKYPDNFLKGKINETFGWNVLEHLEPDAATWCRSHKHLSTDEYFSAFLNEAKNNVDTSNWQARFDQMKQERAEILDTFPLKVASADALPFGEESFDLVLSRGAPPTTWMNNVDEVRGAVEEAVRVLKKGGEYRFGKAPLSPEIWQGKKEPIEHTRIKSRWLLQGIFPDIIEEPSSNLGDTYYRYQK